MVTDVGYRSTEYQRELFAPPLKAAGSVRNVCGDFIELCTAKVSGAKRLKTDSRVKICPDLHLEDNIYFECKSVGRTNVAIIYKHRVEKEQAFVAAGNQVVYWIWHHVGRVGDGQTKQEIREIIAANMRCVYVVSHAMLSDFLTGLPVQLNSHYYQGGPGRKIFRGDGWKVPLKTLREKTHRVDPTAPMYVRGVFVKSVPIYLG